MACVVVRLDGFKQAHKIQGNKIRRAARTDNNQKEIVQALRKAGRKVWISSGVGDGFPDLVVAVPSSGKTYLLECKGKYGKLTEAQQEFFDNWPLQNLHIVRTIEEALQITV